MLQNDEIDDDLFKNLKCTGSQPARLYGLAKVHSEYPTETCSVVACKRLRQAQKMAHKVF